VGDPAARLAPMSPSTSTLALLSRRLCFKVFLFLVENLFGVYFFLVDELIHCFYAISVPFDGGFFLIFLIWLTLRSFFSGFLCFPRFRFFFFTFRYVTVPFFIECVVM